MSSGGVEPSPAVAGTVRRRAPAWWTVISGVIIGAAALCCSGLLWMMLSNATGDALTLLLVLACLGLLWVVWSLIGLFAYGTGRISLIAPAVVMLTVGVAWSGLPKQVGWWLSASALEQAALACDPADADRTIGVYEVSAIRAKDNGCLLTLTDWGITGPAGYAYMPHGEPPAPQHEYDENYRHVDGPWYTYSL